jgi:hypothetical protein
MKKITENSLTGRALIALSRFRVDHDQLWLSRIAAWIVIRFGEQPLIGDDWNDELRAEAALKKLLAR